MIPSAWAASRSIRDLNREVENLIRLKRLAEDALLQRLALQELHGNEVLPLMLVDLVDRADVGMIEGGGRLGFPLKPFQCVTVFGYCFRQELQGDKRPSVVSSAL